MSMIDSVTGSLTKVLVIKALDAAVLRHQAIASNIANAGSMGYQPLRVNFEQQLGFARLALSGGASLTAADVSSLKAFMEREPAPNAGTPAVMIDMEVVKLSQNTLQYQALVKGLNNRGSILSAAINELRR